MSRKLMVTLALALVMVLSVSAAVFAQGPGPANTQGGQQMWQQQDGTGLGTCTDFVDEDGDCVGDHALMDSTPESRSQQCEKLDPLPTATK